MATLAELFVLLDGWEEQTFDERIALTPDAALEAARSALASGAGLDDALTALERQIAVAAPALRAARYDLIESTAGSEREITPDLLRRMLCDLHLAAFRIQRRLGAAAEARAHLIRAAASESGDDAPRLYFVEFYVELEEYAAAVATLDAAVRPGTYGAFSLLELGVDLVARGAISRARDAFERAGRRDPVGLVASVCSVLTEDLDGAEMDPPTTDELQATFSSAGRALGEGREDDALEGFLFVVAHEPKAARAWFGVGCAHRNLAERETGARGRDPVDLVLALALPGRDAASDQAHTGMAYAAEAFRLALALDPTMWPAADALVWAELWLDRPTDALEAALGAEREHAGNTAAVATLSVALLMNRLLDDAERAAAYALEHAPDDPVASWTLAMVHAARDEPDP